MENIKCNVLISRRVKLVMAPDGFERLLLIVFAASLGMYRKLLFANKFVSSGQTHIGR